tara:strand:+ start:1203 stop:1457 length:255 start_codon:yes stop_codon:yes gene_type:complete
MAVSQAKNILAHLVQHRTITPLEALNQYGCFRLSAVIFNLKKDGHDITTIIKRYKKKKFAEYHYNCGPNNTNKKIGETFYAGQT